MPHLMLLPHRKKLRKKPLHNDLCGVTISPDEGSACPTSEPVFQVWIVQHFFFYD